MRDYKPESFYIENICKKCNYFRQGCWYDYGDSLTKIPCTALNILMGMGLIHGKLLEQYIKKVGRA